MADSEEMRRLILHAAALLDGQRDKLCSNVYDARFVLAAVVNGAATLRMVAACMGVEERPQPVAPSTVNLEPPAGPRRTQRTVPTS